jgi:hypothetical protein
MNSVSQLNINPTDITTRHARTGVEYFAAVVSEYQKAYGDEMSDTDMQVCATLAAGLLAAPEL